MFGHVVAVDGRVVSTGLAWGADAWQWFHKSSFQLFRDLFTAAVYHLCVTDVACGCSVLHSLHALWKEIFLHGVVVLKLCHSRQQQAVYCTLFECVWQFRSSRMSSTLNSLCIGKEWSSLLLGCSSSPPKSKAPSISQVHLLFCCPVSFESTTLLEWAWPNNCTTTLYLQLFKADHFTRNSIITESLSTVMCCERLHHLKFNQLFMHEVKSSRFHGLQLQKITWQHNVFWKLLLEGSIAFDLFP